jgi:predicted DNA-binding transcriptional regulator YafY
VRADRLVAIVLLLQTHGQLTAGALAEMLDTSERTIRRDLDALLVSGVPLYSLRGRGGGWTLLGGHHLNLSGFTVDEARALFLVAGARPPTNTAEGANAEPKSGELQSALRKLLAALPEPLRHEASAAEGAVVVDSSGWGHPTETSPHLAELQAAVLDRRQVDLEYAKPGGGPERRRVHPYGLVTKRGVWYLLGGTDAGRRTFRLSRIHAVSRTEAPVELPPDFDLANEWDESQRDFAERMRVVQVELEVADHAVLRLSAAVRGWASAEEHDDPSGDTEAGWRRITATFPHVGAAAASLAPFGDTVRILEPRELRDELRALGEALVRSNRASL